MPTNDANVVSYKAIALEALAFVRINGRAFLASAIAGFLIAATVVHFTPLQYRASIMVAAQEGLSTNSGIGNLEDIAGLTGGLGGSSFQPFDRFTQTLTNRTVAEKLLVHSWVLPTFFPEEWDAKAKTWHRPTGIAAIVKHTASFLLGLQSWHAPGAQELSQRLSSIVQVSKFGRNPAYSISFEHSDPAVAARILDLLLKTNDAVIQQDAQARLTNTTSYLQQRLKDETEVNRRNALSQLLLEQERSLMAAEATGPYAAKVIDRMSVIPSEARKMELGAAAFIIVFLILFCGIKLTRHARQSVS